MPDRSIQSNAEDYSKSPEHTQNERITSERQVSTHSGHRGFRKAADQPDGSPASFASRKLPFAASHTRPEAAGHQSIRIAVVGAGGYAKRLCPESIRSPTMPAAAFPALLSCLARDFFSKQAVVEHVIRHPDVMPQNCRQKTKLGVTGMDWLTFIAKLVEFLAWPVAAVVLVAVLRTELRQLLPHVKKLKAGPVEAEFEREVKELQKEVSAQPAPVPLPEGLTAEWQMLFQLVQVNPRSAILEAWRGVEEAALRLVQSKGLYVSERDARSAFAVIRAIGSANVLSAEDFALYHDLRGLRNQAAHATDFTPTTDAALSYVGLASRLCGALEQAAK